MSNQITYGDRSRQALLRGINSLANAVRVTLGPRGRNASKTSDVAGDGTTTATVLAQAIYREGLKNVVAGASPREMKVGIDKAVEAIVASLTAQAKPVAGNMIAQIGT